MSLSLLSDQTHLTNIAEIGSPSQPMGPIPNGPLIKRLSPDWEPTRPTSTPAVQSPCRPMVTRPIGTSWITAVIHECRPSIASGSRYRNVSTVTEFRNLGRPCSPTRFGVSRPSPHIAKAYRQDFAPIAPPSAGDPERVVGLDWAALRDKLTQGWWSQHFPGNP